MSNIIELKDISKSFIDNGSELLLFKDVNLAIAKGESISITGPSGSGKSTLLHIAATIETPTSGTLLINGKDVKSLSDDKKALLRRNFSFMFQKNFLFPSWTVEENIMLPLLISSKKQDKNKKNDLLHRFNLESKLHTKARYLSGGEKSRLSLIRAIMSDGVLVFADEPTGSLDRDNARIVEDELFSLVKDYNKSLLFVTHSEELSKRADKMYKIENKTLLKKGNTEC